MRELGLWMVKRILSMDTAHGTKFAVTEWDDP